MKKFFLSLKLNKRFINFKTKKFISLKEINLLAIIKTISLKKTYLFSFFFKEDLSYICVSLNLPF